MARKGMGKGTGKGYKNIISSDKKIHSQSAKGIKQPQRINPIIIDPKKRLRAELIALEKSVDKVDKLSDIDLVYEAKYHDEWEENESDYNGLRIDYKDYDKRRDQILDKSRKVLENKYYKKFLLGNK